MNDKSVTIALMSPAPMVSVRSMNIRMSSEMRWSGLSAVLPSNCMR